jgi:hypothetical protein
LKIKFENNQKNRSSLALLYLAVFFVIITFFVKGNYIDFAIIRSLYIPIFGISMLAIMFDYLIFGHVFLVSSLFGLILRYTSSTNPSIKGIATNNTIIIFGLIIGLLLQMYIKIKNK